MLKVVVLIMINEKDSNFGNLNNALETLIRDEVLKQNVKIRREIQEIEEGLTDLENKFEEAYNPQICVNSGPSKCIIDTPQALGFPDMLHSAINEIGDTLWRRESWDSNRQWVCLTRPTDIQRHFTERICKVNPANHPSLAPDSYYDVYIPTTQDLLAKDWVRV